MTELGGEPDDLAGIDDVVTPRNDDEDDASDTARASIDRACLAVLSTRVPDVPHSAPGRLSAGIPPLRAAGLRESNAASARDIDSMELSLQVPVPSESTLMQGGDLDTGNGHSLHPSSVRKDFISALEANLKVCWFPKRRKRPMWAFYQPAVGDLQGHGDNGKLHSEKIRCWVCCGATGSTVSLPIGPRETDAMVQVPDCEGPKNAKVKKEFVYVSRHGLEGLSWHVQNNHGAALRELEDRMAASEAGDTRRDGPGSADGKGGRRPKRKTPISGAAVDRVRALPRLHSHAHIRH